MALPGAISCWATEDMNEPRTILHLDLDAFFCAVEEQHNPALRGRPLPWAGGPRPRRGVVGFVRGAALRRAFGHADGAGRAPVPRAVVVPPNCGLPRRIAAGDGAPAPHDAAGRADFDRRGLSGCDRAGRAGRGAGGAPARGIRDELALSCSLGVAANKLVAKIATDVGKSLVRSGAMPNAICVVPPGEEAAFLAPLPAGALWGVGPKTAEKLAAMGIRTIGAIAAWPAADLERRFGQHGEDLSRRARGIDERPIVTERAAKVDLAGKRRLSATSAIVRYWSARCASRPPQSRKSCAATS